MTRNRTVTTDGNAIITDQGRLITTEWRQLNAAKGRCRAYRGFTWVVLDQGHRYMAQLSGEGRPVARRFFTNPQEAEKWLKRQADANPIVP